MDTTEIYNIYPDSYISACGGFKNDPSLYEAVEQYLHIDTCKPSTKALIRQTLDYVDANGQFQSREALTARFAEPSKDVNSISEAVYYLNRYYKQLQCQSLSGTIQTVLNTVDADAMYDPDVLVVRLQEALDKADFGKTTDVIVEKSGDFTKIDPNTENGISTGVKGIDELITVGKGLSPHQISTICAFTSEGKSTWANSIAYNALKEGKKVFFYTLEVAWQELVGQIESRWLFDRGITNNGNPITPTSIVTNTLPDTARDYLSAHMEEFYDEIYNNAYFSSFDEDDIRIFKSAVMCKNRLQAVAQHLGGLDLIVIDHVTLFSTVSGDYKIGNMILGTIRDVVKDFEFNGKGVHTIWCAQMSRAGHKSVGDLKTPSLSAIAELSETERSSHQVFVMSTKEDDKVNQTTNIYVKKNRGGRTSDDPIVTRFIPERILVGFTDVGGGGGSAGDITPSGDFDFNSLWDFNV